MNNINLRMHYLLMPAYMALAWMLFISIFTLLKVAPDYLNADTILNSVMSLQNLTIYYWGQNRLLNVLPFIAAIVKNPALNLAVIMLLASMSLYGLLYLLARSSAILLGLKNIEKISLKVFLVTSSAFVFIFSPLAVYEMAIGHIEYSLPSLLLVFAAINICSNTKFGSNPSRLILPIAALTLAIGMNPSTIIPAFFIVVAVAFFHKRLRLNEIIFLLVSVPTFFVWDLVSKHYGNLPYNKFGLEIFYSGLRNVIEGLLSTLNLPAFFLLIAIIGLLGVFCVASKSPKKNETLPLVSYVTGAVTLFSILWLFLFSSSRWVEMNQFHWRYFTFIIFAMMFLCSVSLTLLFKNKGDMKVNTLVAITAVSAFIFLALPNPRVHFSSYAIYQHVDALTEPGGRLYSGDYWVVWPSVMRDMMAGYDAYGLTLRGEANEEAAREFILSEIRTNGQVSVYCLNDTIQNCISQVSSTAGPLHVVGSSEIKTGVSLVNFAE